MTAREDETMTRSQMYRRARQQLTRYGVVSGSDFAQIVGREIAKAGGPPLYAQNRISHQLIEVYYRVADQMGIKLPPSVD